jgi:SAM-dependent methyltransferase
VCPRCRGNLAESTDELACGECESAFPIIAGIPDLRVSPDPWIGMEDDRLKGMAVLEKASGQDFEGHVRTYWSMTPTTTSEHADRFVDHVLRAESRSREWLGAGLGPDDAEDPDAPSRSGSTWLDLGCGTADLAAAAPPGVTVVGVDIAMRWLVVAQRRLKEAGIACHLVCANAEALPFPTGTFAHVVSLGMVEHCKDLDAVVHEARRVLVRGGSLKARTVNRFSMLPEPHVGVWGVGLVPRAWADRYVRLRSGLAYEHHHPWSPGVIRRALRRAGFARVSVQAAATLRSDLGRGGRLVKMLTPTYESARRIPGLRRAVTVIAPLLDLAGVAR